MRGRRTIGECEGLGGWTSAAADGRVPSRPPSHAPSDAPSLGEPAARAAAGATPLLGPPTRRLGGGEAAGRAAAGERSARRRAMGARGEHAPTPSRSNGPKCASCSVPRRSGETGRRRWPSWLKKAHAEGLGCSVVGEGSGTGSASRGSTTAARGDDEAEHAAAALPLALAARVA